MQMISLLYGIGIGEAKMNDGWVAWAAILGAAAWIPQVVTFLFRMFAKPSLQFLPSSTVEIGYTSYGPILNPGFAISTKRKDALIEKIKLLLRHEDGDEHELQWQFLSEPQYEIESSTGEIQTSRKNQPVAGLKVTTAVLIDRKIGFQDVGFINRRMEIYNRLLEKEEHVRKVKPDGFPELLFEEKEWTDIENFIRDEFYWKAGKYTLTLMAYETSKKRPYVESYVFEMTRTQIEILARNVEITQQAMKYQYLYNAHKAGAPLKFIWAWITPFIIRQTNRH